MLGLILLKIRFTIFSHLLADLLKIYDAPKLRVVGIHCFDFLYTKEGEKNGQRKLRKRNEPA